MLWLKAGRGDADDGISPHELFEALGGAQKHAARARETAAQQTQIWKAWLASQSFVESSVWFMRRVANQASGLRWHIASADRSSRIASLDGRAARMKDRVGLILVEGDQGVEYFEIEGAACGNVQVRHIAGVPRA